MVSLLGSLCYVELGTLIPQSGGEYTYIRLAYGELSAFVYIWATAVVTKPLSLAIICLVSAQYLVSIFEDSEPSVWQVRLTAISVCAMVTAINCVSVTCASRVNILFTVIKIAALAMVGLLGLAWISKNVGKDGTAAHRNFAHPFAHSNNDVSSFGVAVLAGLWGFDGWNNLNLVVDEIKNPAKILPRAVLIGVFLVTIIYLFGKLRNV